MAITDVEMESRHVRPFPLLVSRSINGRLSALGASWRSTVSRLVTISGAGLSFADGRRWTLRGSRGRRCYLEA